MDDLGAAIALSVAAVAHNNVANWWKPFHGWAYVPVNVVFAGLVTIAAAAILGLSARDLGVRGDLSDVTLPLAIVAVVGVSAFSIAGTRHGHRIADERVEGMRGRTLAFYVLVRIPVGTAVVEETIFRGVLFAAWQEAGASTVGGALWASIAFGLWHISPTIVGVRMNDPSASARKLSVAVFGAVVFTTVAGLGLTWLRVWTDGLLAPIVLHAGVNSVCALAAARAWRRLDVANGKDDV